MVAGGRRGKDDRKENTLAPSHVSGSASLQYSLSPALNRRYILGEADKEASQSTGVWQPDIPPTCQSFLRKQIFKELTLN
jgi:hypothetical protein